MNNMDIIDIADDDNGKYIFIYYFFTVPILFVFMYMYIGKIIFIELLFMCTVYCICI